jgi:uncharacterized membrane protein
MKRWQEFLFWLVCISLIDVFFLGVKNLTGIVLLNKWAPVVASFIMFVIGWIGVWFAVKSLKHKRTNTEKKNWLITGFVCVVEVWSVFLVFDTVEYFLENDMLRKSYFGIIIIVSMFLGWAAARVEPVLFKQKKKRK